MPSFEWNRPVEQDTAASAEICQDRLPELFCNDSFPQGLYPGGLPLYNPRMSSSDPWMQNPNINRRVTLVSRPVGEPRKADFKLVEEAVPEPGDGQLLCRTVFLSIDPYMRGRMNDTKSYADPVGLGEVMVGESIAEVVKSNDASVAVGSYVRFGGGWQDYFVCNANEATVVMAAGAETDPAKLAGLSRYLGVLGMPGLTAFVGLLDIGEPKDGETVVVSAATGAVGSIVGQLARIHGCRVVGVAGSGRKCDYAINTLGFDDCVNHYSDRFKNDLAAACPNGIDVYFENVGGKVFENVLANLNIGARIPLCGGIAYYNLTALPKGGDKVPVVMRALLVQRVKLQGFLIPDHEHRREEFESSMHSWLDQGMIQFREDFTDGLAHAPAALFDVLSGSNFGKKIVRVGRIDSV